MIMVETVRDAIIEALKGDRVMKAFFTVPPDDPMLRITKMGAGTFMMYMSGDSFQVTVTRPYRADSEEVI